ncbi:MAG: trimethylamine methyltransferase family protein [Alphaproteobacteria bacterium]|nr:trimethylamine methyltransferase family protein [Alphaproteobacteria bacterium]
MTADTEGRRRGGREARRARRAQPLPLNEAPIRPGMEGGQYKPLDDAGVARIHGAVLDVLEQIGLAQAIPSCVEACTAKGAVMGADGRLRFPRALVEDTVAKANRRFVMYGQDPRHDMEPWGNRVYFGTAGAAVEVVDVKNRRYRESLLADLYDMARLVDVLDNIHFFQRTCVPRDMPTARDMDFNTLYACVSGTTKHVGSSWVNPLYVEKSFDMLHLIAGGEKKWRDRPFVSQSNCFVVPPLKFAEDACRCLEAAVKGGMPVLLLSAGQAGATAPAALAGAVVQAVAEVLAGLVYVNALKPGHPAIFGTWPFVSDLRTGAMCGGSAEQALLSAACGQMAHFYDLVGGAAAGMCDAKLPDAQAGYEKGVNLALAGVSGLNLVYEAAGMHASLLGFSLESLVIDNDIIGQAQRAIRGIDVDDDSLSVEAMREVCIGGPGHYLGHEQTLRLMQSAYVYPQIGDRSSPKEWVERGEPDILTHADRRMREILSSHYPHHVADDVDAEIRRQFDIKLPRAAMSPGDGRWEAA